MVGTFLKVGRSAFETSNRIKVLVFLKRYCSFEGKIDIVLILFNVFSVIEISDFFFHLTVDLIFSCRSV